MTCSVEERNSQQDEKVVFLQTLNSQSIIIVLTE